MPSHAAAIKLMTVRAGALIPNHVKKARLQLFRQAQKTPAANVENAITTAGREARGGGGIGSEATGERLRTRDSEDGSNLFRSRYEPSGIHLIITHKVSADGLNQK